MELIDTHAHLYAEQFEADRSAMLQRAFDTGLSHLCLPNIDLESIPGMLALQAQHPGRIHAMMGLHPCSVTPEWPAQLAEIHAQLAHQKPIAIGEIGLDYYWSTERVAEQKQAFLAQCDWASALDLPIVVHARDSLDDLIELCTEFMRKKSLRGVFHCFTGDKKQAQALLDLGFYLGLGGVLTYKKSHLPELVADLPLERLVLETDAPYLSPVPHRGKRNESSYVLFVAQKLAEIKQLDLEVVAQQTSLNAKALFGLV